MNEFYSLDRKIKQSVQQEHRGTITACAYRCPESTIIQLRGTIDCVVKTQHYENKSCLVIKRTKTHTLNATQRREKNAEQCTHDQLVAIEFNRYYNVKTSQLYPVFIQFMAIYCFFYRSGSIQYKVFIIDFAVVMIHVIYSSCSVVVVVVL